MRVVGRKLENGEINARRRIENFFEREKSTVVGLPLARLESESRSQSHVDAL
jgi:hypothetical protein